MFSFRLGKETSRDAPEVTSEDVSSDEHVEHERDRPGGETCKLILRRASPIQKIVLVAKVKRLE